MWSQTLGCLPPGHDTRSAACHTARSRSRPGRRRCCSPSRRGSPARSGRSADAGTSAAPHGLCPGRWLDHSCRPPTGHRQSASGRRRSSGPGSGGRGSTAGICQAPSQTSQSGYGELPSGSQVVLRILAPNGPASHTLWVQEKGPVHVSPGPLYLCAVVQFLQTILGQHSGYSNPRSSWT